MELPFRFILNFSECDNLLGSLTSSSYDVLKLSKMYPYKSYHLTGV